MYQYKVVQSVAWAPLQNKHSLSKGSEAAPRLVVPAWRSLCSDSEAHLKSCTGGHEAAGTMLKLRQLQEAETLHVL